ncbi:hypothetical protein KQI65_10115 [bacterium]|nr:hypothetical protein [bacterium]
MVLRTVLCIAVALVCACSDGGRGSIEGSDLSPQLQAAIDELESDLSMFAVFFPETRDAWEDTMDRPAREYPIGNFRLMSIGDDQKVLTGDSLQGHPYLLALVSATTEEQQYAFYHLLHQQYARVELKFVFLYYRDSTYNASWDEVQKAGWSLPGFVADFDSSSFEKRLFPSPQSLQGNIYLVNAEGNVIASERRTRPLEFLYWTLEHVYDD